MPSSVYKTSTAFPKFVVFAAFIKKIINLCYFRIRVQFLFGRLKLHLSYNFFYHVPYKFYYPIFFNVKTLMTNTFLRVNPTIYFTN